MDRRTLLKGIPLGAAAFLAGDFGWRRLRQRLNDAEWLRPAPDGADPELLDPLRDEGSSHRRSGEAVASLDPDDPFQKIREFDRTYPDDFLLAEDQRALLEVVSARLERAQRLIGHGNFNLLSFDRLLRFANNYDDIGAFPSEELMFLEDIFWADADWYGFRGEKVITELAHEISKREVKKIAGSGHYLFRGEPLEKFEQIRRDIGDSITLTSGVRGLAKQFQLFLRKAVETGGNLSQASRSLAPPGYSYHARGDFDIGKIGLGADNFTEAFADTDEYRKMIDLGYVDIRYHETNPFGVRHEPWHIKIA